MSKRVVSSLGLGIVFFLGMVQFATPVSAFPPACIAVTCAPCPEGHILVASAADCCRCVRVSRP